MCLKDFIKYDLEIRSQRIPLSVIEDEIFKKCVLDDNFIINLPLQDAGIVTTVVGQIIDNSGPSSPVQIAHDLNHARHFVDNFFYDSISVILQTFPGYTAEDVYSLNYDKYLELLAMAERRLLAMGAITEPLQPILKEEEPKSSDVKFKDLNKEPVLDPYHPPPKPTSTPRKNKDLVVSTDQSGQMLNVPEGMTPQDREVYMHMNADKWKLDASEGLDLIYPELMQKLKDGEKITPETIRETRGQTLTEVKTNYTKYKKDLTDGKIEHRPSNPLIANETGEGAKPKAKRPKG